MVARHGNDLSRLVQDAVARSRGLADGKKDATGTRRPGVSAKPSSDSGAIFTGSGPALGSLAMLFPGQGSQAVGMFRDLACRFPRMQAALALWNDVMGPGSGRLSDRIYPPSCFREEDRRRQQDALRDTRFAQPAIGAVSLGLLHILEGFGVRPALVGGHSFGELTALCAAGRIDSQSLARLSLQRGALMADRAGNDDPGAMLAVFAPLDRIEGLTQKHHLDLVLANKNAPGQFVLSGPTSEIERAAGLFREERISSSRLSVSAAFHSRFVAHAESGLRNGLAAIDFGTGSIPVFANTTAAPYPDDPGAAKELLACQLSRPVEFIAQVEAMYHREARMFLEVGPGARLTGLVHSILEGRNHHAIAVDTIPGDHAEGDLVGLAIALANLSALGYPVKLEQWDEGYRVPASAPASSRKLLTVKVCGAHPVPASVLEVRTDQKPNGVPQTVGNGPAIAERARTSLPATHARISTPSVEDEAEHSKANHLLNKHDLLERTMNPPDHDHHSGGNGRTSSFVSASGSRNAVPLTETPAAAAAVAPSDRADLAQAIRQTQENLLALQRLAEQTAQLHRQFLEGQAATQQTFQSLLEHQQRLTSFNFEQGTPPEVRVQPSPFTPVNDPGAQDPSANRDLKADKHSPAPLNGSPTPSIATVSTPGNHVADVLLHVVSEKTGYPVEMLELDMQLDDDLGIDSIKRVEILSALQDRLPEAPAVKPEHLGSLRTLRQIAEFLTPQRGSQPAAIQRSTVELHPGRNGDDHAPAATTTGTALIPAAAVADVLIQVVSDKTGYPVEMLELDMQLDDDLGIDSIKRVEILSALQDRLPEAPAVKPEHLGSLRTLRQIAEFLTPQRGSQPAAIQRSTVELHPGRNGDDHAPAATTTGTALIPAAAVADVLIQVVSEKTGYPVEMLELDMQLDDDLGIDSIKRVEILSALQDRLPEAPAVKPEHLGSLRTLRLIAEFLTPNPAAHHAESSLTEATSPQAGPVSTSMLDCLLPRVIPFAPPDDREPALMSPGSEIWLACDGSDLAGAVRKHLTGRGYEVRLIKADGSDQPDPGKQVAGLIILAPLTSQEIHLVKNAFRLIRAVGPSLRWHGTRGGSVLVAVSRMDGSFGFGMRDREIDPASGALAGLLKTAQHEWPEVQCKAIDLDAAYQSLDSAAERIVSEILRRGPIEVGLTETASNQVELAATSPALLDRRQPTPLRAGEVVVMSGGARGITAEVALGLAKSYQPRLILLGRTPEPTAEAAWLAPLETDAAIRRAIRDHTGQPCTPQTLNEQLRQIRSQREIRRNLERISAAGSEVSYHAIDARNCDLMKDMLAEVFRRSGPIRGLIHGAGVLADRRIEDLTDAQFAHVFDTKVEGLISLFQSVDAAQLRFLVLFSSSTARFGRVGQAAYAAANEWLNKWAQRVARRLPACRVVAFNWGPWNGGMVTESLKTVFEREGLGLIAPADGARLVVDVLQTVNDRSVEIVVLAKPENSASADAVAATPNIETGGDTAASAPRSHGSNGKMEPVFERRIDLGSLPVIRSHVIDGHAVLPMALILEWLAEGALHRHPGMVAQSVENLRLLKGVVLRDHRASAVSIRVGKGHRRGETLIVPVEMRGSLDSGREVIHARCDVTVSDRHSPNGERLIHEVNLSPLTVDRDEIYRRVLFHGPAMQAIQQIEGRHEQTIAAWVSTSPPPASWMERPFRQSWITDPLAIDAAFQLVVLWTRERLGASSLPTAVGAYRQFQRAFPTESIRVIAAVREHSDHRALADIEFLDKHANLVARIESYECVIDASLNQAFRRNRLSQHELASS